MTTKHTTGIVLLAICTGLTIWQAPNIAQAWRWTRDFERFLTTESRTQNSKDPVLPAGVTGTDPEASRMFEYMRNRLIPQPLALDDTAACLLDYPDNEFFLYHLAADLRNEFGVDPGAAEGIADRLVAMAPDNAHYHHLAAATLLDTTTLEETSRVLPSLQRAGECTAFYHSYEKYADRLHRLIEKAGGTDFVALPLTPWEFQPCRDLARTISDRAKTAADLTQVRQPAIQMTLDLLDHPQRRIDLIIGVSSLATLQRTALADPASPAQQEAARSELARASSVRQWVLDKETAQLMAGAKTSGALAGLILTAVGFFAFAACWLIAQLLSRWRGRAVSAPIPRRVWLYPAATALLYLALIALVNFDTAEFLPPYSFASPPEWFEHLGTYLLAVAGATWLLISLLGLLPPLCNSGVFHRWKEKSLITTGVGAAGLVVCLLYYADDPQRDNRCLYWTLAVTGFIVLSLVWRLLRKIPPRILGRNRFLHLVLLAALFAGLNPYVNIYGHIVWGILLAIAVLTIAAPTDSSVPPLLSGLYRLAGRSDQARRTRARVAALAFPYAVLLWLAALVLLPLTVGLLRRLETQITSTPPTFSTLAPPGQEAYRFLFQGLAEHRKGYSYRADELYLIRSSDLDEALAAVDEVLAKIHELDDRDDIILLAMSKCSPDAVPCFIAELHEPDSERALIVRAQRGDASTKEKLQKLFDLNRKAFQGEKVEQPSRKDRFSMPPEPGQARGFDLAAALAHISPPPEAMQRYLDTLAVKADPGERHPFRSTAYSFFTALKSLPGPQANGVLHAYLEETEYADLFTGHSEWAVAEALRFYGDPAIAAEVLRRTVARPPAMHQPAAEPPVRILGSLRSSFALETPEDTRPTFWQAIAPWLDADAIPLLLECLDSDTPDLRAFAVWQLNRLKHEWSPAQLQSLRQDPSWKVRLNALFAPEHNRKAAAATDPNPTVAAIAAVLFEHSQPTSAHP